MPPMDIILLWSDYLVASISIWSLLIIGLLYLGRIPAHKSVKSISRWLRNTFRISAHAVKHAENALAQRIREVLLSNAAESIERTIEREFQRVNNVVARDLSGYPNLQRQLNEKITLIDEDYKQSTEVPPEAPGWTKAVETVAKLKNDDSGLVGKVLVDIHCTIKKSQASALVEYRKSCSKRHTLLKQMMPHWRGLSKTLDDVARSIKGLEDRSVVIDHQMEQYENIRTQTSTVERTLSSSSMTQFFIAGLILSIAIIGGVVNFYLIALPMSEMVGANSVLGPFKASNVAAMVIITLEIAMGIFLMESLRITRMFPVIATLDDKMRRRMIWITFTLLFILAAVESSLAFMRDLLAADREALVQTLSGVQAGNPEFRWIPSVGQMVMGFVLPFTLTFVAIPLESFIHSARTVIGVIAITCLRILSMILRVTGNLLYYLGHVLINLYDLLIFIPLRIEDLFFHYLRPKTPVKDRPEKKTIKVDDIEQGYRA